MERFACHSFEDGRDGARPSRIPEKITVFENLEGHAPSWPVKLFTPSVFLAFQSFFDYLFSA